MDRQSNFQEFEKLFWKLSREMGYLWKNIYEEKLPGSQAHLLFLLERNGPKKMSELAHDLHLTPGAITTASDHLIEHKYIERISDENDRRVVRLKLTGKGKTVLHELQNEGRKIMKIVFNDISDEHLDAMNTIFKTASINISEIGKDFD